MSDKVTIRTLQAKKARGEKITALTAYDATFARLLDQAGVDLLLVGDSLGMVVQGHRNTLPVTLEEVIYHSRAVARGAQRAHLVADMPFLSYQVSPEEALRNAGRLLREGGAEAVKLEGGVDFAPTIAHLWRAGIPVMGHIGLTPQSVHRMGGFRVQGRDEEAARRLLDDARALEQAGCYALVLEGIPRGLAAQISREVTIPTIGIGAGPGCDGQVLVIYDLLGMDPDFQPKFLKKYANLGEDIPNAVRAYIQEVRSGLFPAEEQSFADRQPRLRAVEGDATAVYGGGK